MGRRAVAWIHVREIGEGGTTKFGRYPWGLTRGKFLADTNFKHSIRTYSIEWNMIQKILEQLSDVGFAHFSGPSTVRVLDPNYSKV